MSVKVARTELDSVADRLVIAFHSAGFRRIEPSPIIPADDRTLTFANSAVVPFKPYWRGSVECPEPGVFVEQPCIRSFNLDVAEMEAFRTEYLLHFRMFGAMGHSPALVTSRGVAGLLDCGITPSELRCAASADDVTLVAAWRTLGFPETQLILDRDRAEYYQWTFGTDGVSGRGLTIFVDRADGRRRELGNVVEFTSVGIGKWWGFGVGLESVRAAVLGSPWVISISPAAGAFPLTDETFAKLADLLWMLVIAQRAGAEPRSSGAGAVFRRAVFAARSLCNKLNVNRGQLNGWLAELGSAASNERVGDMESLAETILPNAPVFTGHLSFRCPQSLTTSLVAEAARTSCADWSVVDVQVIDQYVSPTFNEMEHSVTLSVSLAWRLRNPSRKQRREALGTIAANLSALGAIHRGHLG